MRSIRLRWSRLGCHPSRDSPACLGTMVNMGAMSHGLTGGQSSRRPGRSRRGRSRSRHPTSGFCPRRHNRQQGFVSPPICIERRRCQQCFGEHVGGRHMTWRAVEEGTQPATRFHRFAQRRQANHSYRWSAVVSQRQQRAVEGDSAGNEIVPSIGSMIHRRPDVPADSPRSSPNTSSFGNRSLSSSGSSPRLQCLLR